MFEFKPCRAAAVFAPRILSVATPTDLLFPAESVLLHVPVFPVAYSSLGLAALPSARSLLVRLLRVNLPLVAPVGISGSLAPSLHTAMTK